MAHAATHPATGKAHRRRHHVAVLVAVLAAYLALAYALLPATWHHYVRTHPQLEDLPGRTQTSFGLPADPINVALIGTEHELRTAMHAAGWYPADPLGVRSDVRIAADAVLERPYDTAPVSSLYLFGRREDLAFEKPVGRTPRRRHHVRFWQATPIDAEQRPTWLGSATYYQSVGFSHTTGQITHHIAPDIDTERDALLTDLRESGGLSEMYFVRGFQTVRSGRNGGGDRWHTDGDLGVGRLVPRSSPVQPSTPP